MKKLFEFLKTKKFSKIKSMDKFKIIDGKKLSELELKICCAIVCSGLYEGSCGRKAIFASRLKTISPESGERTPAIVFKRVDFPIPLVPIIAILIFECFIFLLDTFICYEWKRTHAGIWHDPSQLDDC